jgi:hypothetical protein
MLSFATKRFDGGVPEPGALSSSSGRGLDAEDRALLAKVEAGFETVGALYNACKVRAAPSVPSGQAWARPWPARPQCRSCEATAKLTLRVSPGPQGALVPDQGRVKSLELLKQRLRLDRVWRVEPFSLTFFV